MLRQTSTAKHTDGACVCVARPHNAGLAADEGVVSGPYLNSNISSSSVRGPGALMSRVALLPSPQYGSRSGGEEGGEEMRKPRSKGKRK